MTIYRPAPSAVKPKPSSKVATAEYLFPACKDGLTSDQRHHVRKKAAARAQIDAFRMSRYSLLTIE
jgi:hypothetical protein